MSINKKNNVIMNFQYFLKKILLRGNSLYKLEIKIEKLTKTKFNFQVNTLNFLLVNSIELLDFTMFFYSKDKITGLFSYCELLENNRFLYLDEFYVAYKDCFIEPCGNDDIVIAKLLKSNPIILTRFNDFNQPDWGLLFEVLERNKIIINSNYLETKFSEFNSINLKLFTENPLLNLLAVYFKFKKIKIFQRNFFQFNEASSSSWEFFSNNKNFNIKLLLEKKIKPLFLGQLMYVNLDLMLLKFHEQTIAFFNFNPSPIFDAILNLDLDVIEFNASYYNIRLNKIFSKEILINNLVFLNKPVSFNKPKIWLDLIENNLLLIKKLNSYLISEKAVVIDSIKIKNKIYGDLEFKLSQTVLIELIEKITVEFINKKNTFSVIENSFSDIIYYVINNNE